MCISAAAMMAIGAGVSVAGTLVQGQAAARAAAAQAQQDATQAAQAKDAAQQEADRIRRAGDRTRGAARAQLAASGIDVNSGSSLLIDDKILGDSESDAMNTLLTGKRQSDALMTDAGMALARGRSAQRASVLGAIGTGLQGWKGVSSAQLAPAVSDGGYSIGQGSAYGGSRRGL